jgi:hypothetical protein
MASSKKYNNIVIQNLSSGVTLNFKQANIENLKIIQDLKYEETSVVGRMDPIINYTNTKKAYNISILQNFDARSGLYVARIGDDKPVTEKAIKDLFDSECSRWQNKNREKKKYQSFEMGHDPDGENLLYRFLYPAYQELGQLEGSAEYYAGNYYVKSGLFFRLRILNSDKTWFNAYCTITNMTWDFNWPNLKSTTTTFSPKSLKINLQGTVIHDDILKVSSRRIKQ